MRDLIFYFPFNNLAKQLLVIQASVTCPISYYYTLQYCASLYQYKFRCMSTGMITVSTVHYQTSRSCFLGLLVRNYISWVVESSTNLFSPDFGGSKLNTRVWRMILLWSKICSEFLHLLAAVCTSWQSCFKKHLMSALVFTRCISCVYFSFLIKILLLLNQGLSPFMPVQPSLITSAKILFSSEVT